jgi:hypothetical protein
MIGIAAGEDKRNSRAIPSCQQNHSYSVKSVRFGDGRRHDVTILVSISLKMPFGDNRTGIR